MIFFMVERKKSLKVLTALLVAGSLGCANGDSTLVAAVADDTGAGDVTPTPAPIDVFLSDADIGAEPGDVPIVPMLDSDPCICAPEEFCDDSGQCAADACLQGVAVCDSLEVVRQCAEDGSDWVLEPCDADTTCYLGQCLEPVCTPDDPSFCADGQKMVCNSLGVDFVAVPCPAGTGCKDGDCLPIRANIVLVVDTSGSMSLLYDQADTYPSDCVGPSPTCPPWEWPSCDDPAEPLTRLGRAKLALQSLMNSSVTDQVRLSLVHFPQGEAKVADCKTGHYSWKLGITGDQSAHQAGLGWFEPNLSQILAVPFATGTDANDDDALASWFDFTEAVGPDAQSCVVNFDCPSKVCSGGQCQVHTDPELRGDGPTPLGRTLFYVGEYLRYFVLVEGKVCGQDADCGSPHHTCVAGRCRDPFVDCRPTAVILFTDGIDSVDDDPETFFHPRTQAKRLRYGLECTADAHCLAGATCIDGQCSTPELEAQPDKVCKTGQSCAQDSDCPPFDCGLPTPCPNDCEPAHVTYLEGTGNEKLEGYSGETPSVITHVVDASGSASANGLIALNGGGKHVTVDFVDIEALASQLVTLIDVKSDACGP
ncbi:MAG: hypothetical protein ACI9WU_004660 [Myxococcota bacterium]|jgi:hypothetical protein